VSKVSTTKGGGGQERRHMIEGAVVAALSQANKIRYEGIRSIGLSSHESGRRSLETLTEEKKREN